MRVTAAVRTGPCLYSLLSGESLENLSCHPSFFQRDPGHTQGPGYAVAVERVGVRKGWDSIPIIPATTHSPLPHPRGWPGGPSSGAAFPLQPHSAPTFSRVLHLFLPQKDPTYQKALLRSLGPGFGSLFLFEMLNLGPNTKHQLNAVIDISFTSDPA